ncbi:type II toxin-antitoxin system RelE/ParE family toxin [Rugamonas sp.]|uniref:type II toxin-antitoxin system RelE/ParE family toxin n=1 Tax=Rugamonas sp. TaxID=1926287 RepID=UPI0025E5351E|nr:type II toxin-antitoxin system RelE/ParE family toxin [Rugamonas sp.]
MARRIVWSSEALNDVDAIAQYIARRSTANAAKVVKKILSIASDLDRFPHLGIVVPDLNNPLIRQRSIFHYRLIYRVEISEIIILAVIHGRRSLRLFFDRINGSEN